MTQATFGEVNLSIKSLDIDESPSAINEVDIIADPTNPNDLNTVLIGTGNKRTRVRVSAICFGADLAPLRSYFNSKETDLLNVFYNQEEILELECIIDKFSWKLEPEARIVSLELEFVQSEYANLES